MRREELGEESEGRNRRSGREGRRRIQVKKRGGGSKLEWPHRGQFELSPRRRRTESTEKLDNNDTPL